MTKKDYELIADCLKPLVALGRITETDTDEVGAKEVQFAVSQTIYLFSRRLKEDNPNFSQGMFLEAVNK